MSKAGSLKIRKVYDKEAKKLFDSKFEGPLSGLVDPNILEPVLELNSRGLETVNSCSGGHKDFGSYSSRGYITFSKPLSSREKISVKEVLNFFGVIYIKFNKDKNPIQVTFKGLDGPKPPGWEKYLRDLDKLDSKYLSKYNKELARR
jgi:hypothetical protein